MQRRMIATVLTLALVTFSPLRAFSQTTPAADALRARAKIEADGIKSKALSRLQTEATYIPDVSKSRFQAAMKKAMELQLDTLRNHYATADAYLEKQIGYSTPWYATWQGLWNNKEAAAKVFQDIIQDAVDYAQIPAGRERMQQELTATLTDNVLALYKDTRQTFNDILYQAIEEKGLLGPLTPDLVKELVERIDITSHQLSVQEGVIDAKTASPFPTMTAAAIAALLTARIAQAMLERVGIRVGVERAVGGRLGAAFFGPVVWVAMGMVTIYDIVSAKSKAVEKCKEALWKSYRDTSEQLLSETSLRDMTAAVTAGLEQQLKTDQKAARIEIDRFIDGFLVQASSPGYLDFAQSRDRSEALRAFKQVVAVFGRDLAEIPFFTKYELTSDIPADRALPMIKAHGQAFVALYARFPDALKTVMQNERYTSLVSDVFRQPNSADVLLFYKNALDRFGTVDAKATDALILVRQLHPTKRAEDLHKDTLVMMGAGYDRMAALTQQDPQLAATVLEWVMQGQMSTSLMKKLASQSDALLLFSLPVQLGVEPFIQILKTANEDTLLRFVRDFTAAGGRLDQSQAVRLLREDGPGHLALYTQTGENPRAVLARHTLLQEYGGRLRPEVEETLRWLVLYTSVEPHRGTIESLHTIGIPGHWPDAMARPIAGMVSSMGLIPFFMVLAIGAGIVVLVPIGALRFRLLRFPFRRRRKALVYPHDRDVIEVRTVRPVMDRQALPEHRGDETRTD
jgi:hypothetical protein